MKNCNNDFPSFIPQCERPIPTVPACPSVVEGTSLFQAVQSIDSKLNVTINTFNDVMSECYKTLHNLENAAAENGAYYGDSEVWTEQGFLAAESATYTLIHKAACDRRGAPIQMQLGLAYGNTTNSSIKQSIFNASKIHFADKIFPAIQPLTGGWYGTAMINGAPISTRSEPALFTIGFTQTGKMRYYTGVATPEQLRRDTIQNAMGCSGLAVLNSEVASVEFMKNIPEYSTQQSRVLMGQNYDTNEVIWLVCGNKNNVTEKGMTTAAAAKILVDYGCDIAVELTEGVNSAALDKGSMLFVTDNNDVPETYAFWFISRKCFYTTDYERELAELMQNYGACLWQAYLDNMAIAQMKAELADETRARIAADLTLQLNIDTESATRLNEDTKLQLDISRVESESKERDVVLQSNIDDETAARTARDTELKLLIDTNETESIARDTELDNRKVNRMGDVMTGKLTMSNAIIELNNTNGDIATFSPTAIQMDNVFNVDNNNVNVGSKPIINVSDPVQLQDAATKSYVDTSVNTEKQQRISADILLQDRLTAEETARTTADGVINERITTVNNVEVAARTNADDALRAAIAVEKTARETAIANEATTRLSADTALGERITTEIGDRIANAEMLQSAIDTEVTNRETTEAAIIAGLAAEVKGRQDANVLLTEKISQETSARITADNTKLALAGGVMTGDLILNRAPFEDMQAVTKRYVDQATGGGAFGFLPLSGGIMTGAITLSGAPTRNLEAATKKYVDDTVQGSTPGEGYLPITGGEMTGFLTLNADPVNDLEASTKKYVDDVAESGHTILQTAIDGVTAAIVKETTDRTAADSAISLTVTDEVNARTLAVSSVASQITTEKDARIAADNLLLPKTGGTIEGTLTVAKITGLNTPVGATDATSKSYVDAQISSGGSVTTGYVDTKVGEETAARITADNLLLPKAGGAITGELSVSGNVTINGVINATDTMMVPEIFVANAPLVERAVTNKKYVDAAIAGVSGAAVTKAYVDQQDTAERNARIAADNLLMPKAGGTFTGEISVPRITNLNAPNGAKDATNVGYVTQEIAIERNARMTADSLLLPKAGGTITGNLTVNTVISTPRITIENVPVDVLDGVNKLYVDGETLTGIVNTNDSFLKLSYRVTKNGYTRLLFLECETLIDRSIPWGERITSSLSPSFLNLRAGTKGSGATFFVSSSATPIFCDVTLTSTSFRILMQNVSDSRSAGVAKGTQFRLSFPVL